MPVPIPTKPNVMSDMSNAAKQFNHNRLREHNFDIAQLIQANQGSTLDPGSEFCPIDQLELLLGNHPNFPAVRRYITNSMPFIFKLELDDTTRANELTAALLRGNHKSAQRDPKRFLQLISKDVKHGFSLPIPKQTAQLIQGGAAQPLGLVT